MRLSILFLFEVRTEDAALMKERVAVDFFYMMRSQDFIDKRRVIHKYSVSGGLSGWDPPDPISNSEVKPASANGTARVTVWESRTSPEFF